METQKEELSDTEDIPSDFFDDFNKEEFMEGLSVIDSWDDEDNKKPRNSRPKNTAEVVDSVRDLRELIHSGKEDNTYDSRNKYKWETYYRDSPNHRRRSSGRHSNNSSRLDEFIKSGSRRDINKTNEAIKKDKEEKVKTFLAKHLESSENLRPPGTELDEYFNEFKHKERKKTPIKEYMTSKNSYHTNSKEYYESLGQHRKHSPRHSLYSPRRSPRHSSPRTYNKKMDRTYKQRSPYRRSPYHNRRNTIYRSPRRHSPIRHKRTQHSRSPYRHRQHSRSRSSQRDIFLYPKSPQSSTFMPTNMYTNQTPVYSAPVQSSYVPEANTNPNYGYPLKPGPSYAGYGGPYNYVQEIPTMASVQAPIMPVPQPQPVPAPSVDPVAAPSMVPAPSSSSQIMSSSVGTQQEIITPTYDPLAQLVADGKLSKEDYLKLAPNKGPSPMDPKTRVMVLSRCNSALTKLGTLILPKLLGVEYDTFKEVNQEQKSIAPKYCSPLKRQAKVEFNFAMATCDTTLKQNRQLVDKIVAALGLEKTIGRTLKKSSKNMKDVAVQTTKSFCDICDIRDSMTYNEVGTSIEPEHFSTSVYTQVIEQDLASSRSVFNPTGCMSDGGPISIAHMTPAQLVSQLAARAKTLNSSQPMSNQFPRRNQPTNYGYDNRGNKYNNDGYYRY